MCCCSCSAPSRDGGVSRGRRQEACVARLCAPWMSAGRTCLARSDRQLADKAESFLLSSSFFFFCCPWLRPTPGPTDPTDPTGPTDTTGQAAQHGCTAWVQLSASGIQAKRMWRGVARTQPGRSDRHPRTLISYPHEAANAPPRVKKGNLTACRPVVGAKTQSSADTAQQVKSKAGMSFYCFYPCTIRVQGSTILTPPKHARAASAASAASAATSSLNPPNPSDHSKDSIYSGESPARR